MTKTQENHHNQESQEVSPSRASNHKASGISRSQKKIHKKHSFGTVSKKLQEGLNTLNGTNLKLILSDADHDTYMVCLHENP